MLAKAALSKWGEDAKAVGLKEISQLHWHKSFIPKLYNQLTKEQRARVLESHMSLLKSGLASIRARWLRVEISSGVGLRAERGF